VHRGKAAGTGAAGHPQQDRFGLIVARMAERHDVRVETRAGALETCVSGRTGCILDRPSLLPRTRADVLAAGHNRPVERRGKRDGEPLVIGRGRPKLMVEVHQADEAQLAGRVEAAENVRQGHRIRPARDRGNHTRIATEQGALANELPYDVDQNHDGQGRWGWQAW
jgi:hypothetical protein